MSQFTPARATERISALFAQPSKLLCFGRYAIRVPQEAQLDWGDTTINEGFKTYPNAARGDATQVKAAVMALLQEHWHKVRTKDDTAEIIRTETGPQPGGMVLWYYTSDYAKERNTRRFYGVAVRNGHAFSFQGMALNGKLDVKRAGYETLLRNLRYRGDDEAPPREPGVCIDQGFVLDAEYQRQEMFSAGIYLPSLPDVRFSVFSNKMARTVVLGDKGLLARIKEQKGMMGFLYPKLTELREGKRVVNTAWDGEESLVRRKDGTHEFDWEFVSAESNVLRPGAIEVKLYTKVAKDRIGAAKEVSINDAEALDLWDRLLGGLGYRVAVPGGPAGLVDGGGARSGVDGDAQSAEGAVQVSGLRPGDVCPVTGMWRTAHPDPKVLDPSRAHLQDKYVMQGQPLPGAALAKLLNLPPEEFSLTLVKAMPRPEDPA